MDSLKWPEKGWNCDLPIKTGGGWIVILLLALLSKLQMVVIFCT